MRLRSSPRASRPSPRMTFQSRPAVLHQQIVSLKTLFIDRRNPLLAIHIYVLILVSEEFAIDGFSGKIDCGSDYWYPATDNFEWLQLDMGTTYSVASVSKCVCLEHKHHFTSWDLPFRFPLNLVTIALAGKEPKRPTLRPG